MKSVKPGRGPSGMNAIGSVAAVVFGIFWTISAASMGAPIMFPLFGVVFIVVGIVQVIYHFNNATGRNRYSSFDIVDSNEEQDPLAEYIDNKNNIYGTSKIDNQDIDFNFCPYCGTKVNNGFEFCRKCGKKLG